MRLSRAVISPSGVTPAEKLVQPSSPHTQPFLSVDQYAVLLESQSRSSCKKSASKSWCTVFYSTQKPQNAAFHPPYLWHYLTSDTLSAPCLVRGVVISLRKFQRNLGFNLPCTVDRESIGANAFSPLPEDPTDHVQQLSKIWGPLSSMLLFLRSYSKRRPRSLAPSSDNFLLKRFNKCSWWEVRLGHCSHARITPLRLWGTQSQAPKRVR